MFVPETGYTLAFKTGFLRKTKTLPEASEQRAKAEDSFSRDTSVLDIIERSGKQFHPPSLEDAMGDAWSWKEFTESGSLTMMRFSGLVSGEFWELKKIDSKSNDISVRLYFQRYWMPLNFLIHMLICLGLGEYANQSKLSFNSECVSNTSNITPP